MAVNTGSLAVRLHALYRTGTMASAETTPARPLTNTQPSIQNLMFDTMAPSDEQLLRRIAEGDRQAFEALYDRHAGIVYGLILRIVHDRALADDLLQEAFWQLWKRAAEWRGEGKAAAWLYRIARNRSLDEVRRRQRSATENAESLDLLLQEPGQTAAARHPGNPLMRALAASKQAGDAAREFSQEQSRRHVNEALSSIPAEQRVCLELAYFEGMSQQQIAQHVNLPLGTVKTRMRMGLAKLEHFLRAQGYHQEDLQS